MAPLHGCVIIAQQWTHIKSNSTLTDFVIREAENDREPSQGPRWTLFHPSNHYKSLVLSSQNHKIQLFRLYTNRRLPSSSPSIPKWDSTFLLCGKNKKHVLVWQCKATQNKKNYSFSSYRSHSRRQGAALPSETPTLLYIPDVSLLNLLRFSYWRN